MKKSIASDFFPPNRQQSLYILEASFLGQYNLEAMNKHSQYFQRVETFSDDLIQDFMALETTPTSLKINHFSQKIIGESQSPIAVRKMHRT